MKKNKEDRLFLIVMGILAVLAITVIILNIILIKKLGETEPELLIKENPKVCYMPKDCFDSEEEYLDQFPGKEEPRYFPECLIYCYN